MGIWNNNPGRGRGSRPQRRRHPRSEKPTVDSSPSVSGSRWTQGRAWSAHLVSILMIAAIVSGPVGLLMAWQVSSRPAQAAVTVQKAGPTGMQQEAGAYAAGFVGAWLSSWQDHPGQLGSYISLNSIQQLSAQPVDYRDLTVARITSSSTGPTVTVVVAANVKELAPNPDKPSAGVETWPRRWFQVPIVVNHSRMRPATLPTPVAAPGQADPVALRYNQPVTPASTLGQAVLAFVQAYTAGQGDLSRYVTAGSGITPIHPAPYRQVTIGTLTATTQTPSTPTDGAKAQVLATVSLTTPIDQSVTATYALTLTAQSGLWVVSAIDQAPALVQASTPPTTSSSPTR